MSGTLGDLIVKIGADPGNFQDVMKGIGDAVDQVGAKFDSVAGQLTALAEGLAFTEALKSFGEEALKTFGQIEKVNISLTALTGDAEGAAASIEHLKDVALSNALSFPALVEASQRMTAFGFETEKIPQLLQAAADAAAATNKDFSETADKIDRIVLSGNTSAKALSGLGLSLKDLGDVMGVSAGEVTALFKTLDQGLRMDIVTAALQKYESVAAETAKGIAGQWQALQTQVEFVFEAIGKALAPVVGQVVEFMKTQIVPYIQSLVDAFNHLSQPVKDAIVGFGLLLVAIVPIVTALAGIGLAVAGLSAIGPAMAGIGVAALAVMPEVVAIGAAIAAVVYGVVKLQEFLDTHPEYKTTSGSNLGKTWADITAETEAAASSNDWQSSMGKVSKDPAYIKQVIAEKAALDEATASAEAYGKALFAAYSQLGIANYNSLLKGTTDDAGNTTQFSGMDAFNALIGTLEGPRLAVAASNLEAALQKAFHDGAISAEEFNGDVDQIEQKLNTARDAGVNLGETLPKAFALPTGFIDISGQFDTVSTSLDNAQAHLAKFIDLQGELSSSIDGTGFALLKSTMDAINVDVSNFDSGLLQSQSAAYALGGAMQATLQDIGPQLDSTQKGLFNAFHQGIVGVVSDHDSMLKAMHVSNQTSVAQMIADNAKIQASSEYTDSEKLKSAQNTQKAILAGQDQATQAMIADEQRLTAAIKEQWAQGLQGNTAQEAGLSAIKLMLSGQLDIYTNIHKEVDNMFSSMASAIASAVFNWKGFGNLVDTVLQSVGQSIIKNVIDTLTKPISIAISAVLTDVLKPVLTPIIDVLTNDVLKPILDALGIAIPSAISGGASTASAIATAANTVQLDLNTGALTALTGAVGAAAGTSAASAGVGAAGSAASAGGGIFSSVTDALTGSLGAIVNVISGAVTAISSVIGNFQMSHMNKLLGEMEITTREINNVVGKNGAESIFGYTKASWMDLQVMVNELSDLHNDNVESISTLEQIRDGGTGGGNAPIVSGLGTIADRISELRDASAQIISTLEQGFNIPSPTAPTPPTVPTAYGEDPFRQVGPIGTAPHVIRPGSGGSNAGGASVTVNALNPSARGVVTGIIQGLREIGVKVS